MVPVGCPWLVEGIGQAPPSALLVAALLRGVSPDHFTSCFVVARCCACRAARPSTA